MKTIDMSAFVGKGFDCEFTNDVVFEAPAFIGLLTKLEKSSNGKTLWFQTNNSFRDFRLCRPRLNKPQVLDSWDWAPDGLVWKWAETTADSATEGFVLSSCGNSETLRLANRSMYILLAAVIGVEPEYKEWGEQHGMEVIET